MAFRDVVDQDHAVMLLRAAARSGRPAHAYLLVGPEGVGRRSLALSFAQLLNCERPDGDACGVCTHCRRITEGIHPDVRVLDIAQGRYLVPVSKDYKGREIPIDQIRALKQDAHYPPYEGQWKVYVIAPAELLSPGAANSLLKVLEEPPPRVIVILIAESTVPLPATIVSRCQLVRCALVPAGEIERALTERNDVPPDRARFLAALAAGRIGRALTWANDPAALEERSRFLDVLAQMETAGPMDRLDAAEELARKKDGQDRVPDLLEMAEFWFRDLLVWKETADSSLIVNLDRVSVIERLAPSVSLADLRRRIEAVHKAREGLETNVNPRLMLENLFFKIQAGSL